MDLQTFTELISTVGFPIAVCIALAIYVVWLTKVQKEERAEQQAHSEEVLAQVTKSVDNNTNTLQRLLDKMG